MHAALMNEKFGDRSKKLEQEHCSMDFDVEGMFVIAPAIMNEPMKIHKIIAVSQVFWITLWTYKQLLKVA